MKPNKNPLHDGKRILTGIKKAASTNDIFFKDVKLASKALGMTINDILTACLTTSVSQYFNKQGDTSTKSINITMPANVRFGLYETFEKVKLENKFAPVLLPNVPISSDLDQSLKEVPKVTGGLRTKFGEIYALYAISYFSNLVIPYYLGNWVMMNSTLPFTFAFSNVPGLQKPI